MTQPSFFKFVDATVSVYPNGGMGCSCQTHVKGQPDVICRHMSEVMIRSQDNRPDPYERERQINAELFQLLVEAKVLAPPKPLLITTEEELKAWQGPASAIELMRKEPASSKPAPEPLQVATYGRRKIRREE